MVKFTFHIPQFLFCGYHNNQTQPMCKSSFPGTHSGIETHRSLAVVTTTATRWLPCSQAVPTTSIHFDGKRWEWQSKIFVEQQIYLSCGRFPWPVHVSGDEISALCTAGR